MNASTGKYIILLGALLVLIGTAVYLLHDKLHWIGKLPGDIRIERENFKFYFPLTTMIIFSLMLNILIVLIRKIFG